MKQNNTTKKLALAGVLTALAIVGSFISVPVVALHSVQVYSAICSASEALWLSLEAWSVLYAVVLSTKNSTS